MRLSRRRGTTGEMKAKTKTLVTMNPRKRAKRNRRKSKRKLRKS